MLTKPLTQVQLDALRNDNDRVTVEVSVPLSDLIDNDLEGLNNLIEELILDRDGGTESMMSDIYYAVVGHKCETSDGVVSGEVILSVDFDWS